MKMGSLNAESDPKQELDDSGYVQDEVSKEVVSPLGSINLLDLSDDVLLYILQYCTPRDLKALGYTCSRLSTLVLDRTLWQRVDARGAPSGRLRMRWLLTHALSAHTTALKLSGYAKDAQGCRGFIEALSEEMETGIVPDNMTASEMVEAVRDPRAFRAAAQSLRRYGSGFPYWPDRIRQGPSGRPGETENTKCPGPQVTLTAPALLRLAELCPNLTELILEYCIIDCAKTNISMFPVTLKVLSLRGAKCYNLDKSFLFKIQDRLLLLEELDVSQCEWVEPASMLPLSKVANLTKLVMQECTKLTEFVAYASLATRYGFKKLKTVDLRGSPVGDSEVSALGWLPQLEELYLSPASGLGAPPTHIHTHQYNVVCKQLDDWELNEPEYFKAQYSSEQWLQDEEKAQKNCTIVKTSTKKKSVSSKLPIYNQVLNNPNDAENKDMHIQSDYRHAYGMYLNSSRQTKVDVFARIPNENEMSGENNDDGDRNGDGEQRNDENDVKRRIECDDDEAGPSKRQKTSETNNDDDENKESDEKKPKDDNKSDKDKKSSKDDEKMDDSSDDDDDNNHPPKNVPVPINEGASTSKAISIDPQPSTSRTSPMVVDLPSNNNNRDEPNLNREEPNLNRAEPNLNRSEPKSKKKRIEPNIIIQISTKSKKAEGSGITDADLNIPPSSRDDRNLNMVCDKIYLTKIVKDIQRTIKYNQGRSRERNFNIRERINRERNVNNREPNVNNREPNLNNQAPNQEPKQNNQESKQNNQEPNTENQEPNLNNVAPNQNNQEPNENNQKPNQEAKQNQEPNLNVIEPENKNTTEQSKKSTENRENNDSDDTKKSESNANSARDDSEENPGPSKEKATNTDDLNPRHRVVFVNVRQGRVGEQISFPVRNSGEVLNNIDMNLYFGQPEPRLQHNSVVTDSAIRRFGRADGENVNYVQIGPNGPFPVSRDQHARPDRSNLRILSVTGYINITNASLNHLATAAPRLEFLDLSGTRVTEDGVEHFRNLRPDCEVKFTNDSEKEEPES